MRSVPMTPALTLALVCCCFLGELVQASDRNLRLLCEGKGDAKVTRSSHVLLLANQINDSAYQGVCSQHVREALAELAKLVRDEKACSMQKAEAVTEFYETYVKKTLQTTAAADGQEAAANEANGDKLPKPLVDFVLAYGLKLSVICRRHMADTFLSYAKKRIEFRDFDDLNAIMGRDSAIDRLLRAFTKPGEFLLPVDVTGTLPGSNHENLYLKQASGKNLLEAKNVCELRFQPLYEETLKPIAVLARSGFDLRTLQLKASMWVFGDLHDEMFEWTKVVFMCESLKSVVIDAESSDGYLVNYKATEHGNEVDREVTKTAKNKQIREILELRRYQPTVEVGDKIIGKFDIQLRHAVDSFDPNKTSEQRLEKKITERALQILWERSKGGQHKELIEFISNIGSHKNDPNLEKLKTQLTEVMNSKSFSSFHQFLKLPKALYEILHTIVFVVLMVASFWLLPLYGSAGQSLIGMTSNKLASYQR